MKLTQTMRIAAVVLLFWILVGMCVVEAGHEPVARAAVARIEEEIEVLDGDFFAEYGDLEIANGGMLYVAGMLDMRAGSKLIVKQGGRLRLNGADL